MQGKMENSFSSYTCCPDGQMPSREPGHTFVLRQECCGARHLTPHACKPAAGSRTSLQESRTGRRRKMFFWPLHSQVLLTLLSGNFIAASTPRWSRQLQGWSATATGGSSSSHHQVLSSPGALHSCQCFALSSSPSYYISWGVSKSLSPSKPQCKLGS